MNRIFHLAVLVATLSAVASVPAPAEPAPAALPRIVASPEPGWPQFRGPRRDGTSDERGLLAEWPEGGPKKIWSADKIGRGYSSPIIASGKIFITGDVGDDARIFALDLDGRPLWQAKNGAAWKEEYPGSRASVTFSDGRVYHENAHGRVACLDASNGQELWSIELLARFGGKNITWGLSECLLVDERAVYATAGGSEALLVALDKKTGAVIWKSAPLRDSEGERAIENASYASPILIQYGAQRLIVGCSLRYLFCADAADGTIRWTHRFPTTYSVISMVPALVGDSVFLAAPHGKGGRLLRLENGEERWNTRLDTLQGCVVQTGGKLIGCYYGGRKSWAAISAQSGELLYDTADFVKGAPLLADERIYALCEDGWMLLLTAGEKHFELKGRFRFVESQRDAWAHPVIHNGRLYLRYHDMLSCYDVRAVSRRDKGD